MRKLSKTEQMLLERNKGNYDAYMCPTHGLYQIHRDLPTENHICPYCKLVCPSYVGE